MSDNTNKGELLMKLYKLAVERDTLKQQNAELAAQVGVIGDKLSEVVALLDVDGMTAVQWLLDNCQEIEQLTDFEPEDCLLEVKSEAGRAGFIAGFIHALGDTDEHDAEAAEFNAKQYANKIRGGE